MTTVVAGVGVVVGPGPLAVGGTATVPAADPDVEVVEVTGAALVGVPDPVDVRTGALVL